MRDYRQEDKLVRERLERQASGDAPRLNVVGVLNALTRVDAAREAPGLMALAWIRERQRLERRSPSAHNASHAKWFEAQDERLDRVHPRSIARAELRRRHYDD